MGLTVNLMYGSSSLPQDKSVPSFAGLYVATAAGKFAAFSWQAGCDSQEYISEYCEGEEQTGFSGSTPKYCLNCILGDPVSHEKGSQAAPHASNSCCVCLAGPFESFLQPPGEHAATPNPSPG